MKTSIFSKPTIILVDDHIIFRQGLKSLITAENLGTVIGEASDGNEFIHILTHPAPNLVIMDIDMPNMNGMEAAKKALELFPNLKIIVFTMFGDDEYLQKMISLGVKGFILKSNGITEIEKSIHDVINGKTYFSKSLSSQSVNKMINRKHLVVNEESKKTPIPWW